ncbi:GNAT family N-acetyltransferase [Tengunoibacter tsumagoiensis]|uniref:Acetyltransferase n=1 Tax=Tengunoibacter tsumagoiensis TaxID=2014871 RepID=A0A402A500_9CHLR|nr:GNAT family N-acetyltransferase [Tengunoibacter tsumagoiensis]GCE14081.1 acetyltransferase [Tengunoibacter tsumagoiensis]
MPTHQLQGLVQRQALSSFELQAVQQLAEICEKAEQIHLRVIWDLLRERLEIEALDFLYYDDGAVVGYLCLDDHGMEAKEVVAYVHPAYRRRGIFRQLLAAAWKESRLFGIERYLFICDEQSQSGLACLQAIGATLDFSEHDLILHSQLKATVFDHRLHVRQATLADLEALAQIQSESFGDPINVVRLRLAQRLENPLARFSLATLGEPGITCHEPVGCLRVRDWQAYTSIYGFGVRPDYQGKGYGRQLLETVIAQLQRESSKPVQLDVDTSNQPADHLYRSCGFQPRATYGYYALSIKDGR